MSTRVGWLRAVPGSQAWMSSYRLRWRSARIDLRSDFTRPKRLLAFLGGSLLGEAKQVSGEAFEWPISRTFSSST